MLYSRPRLGSLSLKVLAGSFRKTAFTLTTAAALVFASAAAHAGEFTAEQCKLIAHVGVDVARFVGPEKLSQDFKTSFRNFLGPNLTCDGPKEIYTSTVDDVATFNSIKDILAHPPQRIDLERAGLRSLDPKAAQRPTASKRSDLGRSNQDVAAR